MMEIDKILETHLYLYNQVCSERRQLEAECARYRRLLKPWHFSPVASQGEVLKESEAEKKGPLLIVGADQRDEKELKLIDNVLAKAEKTWNRHSKELRGNIAGGDSQRGSECTVNNTPASRRGHIKDRINQSLSKSDRRNVSTKLSQVGVISQSKLNQLVKKNVCDNQSKKCSTITAVHSKAPFKTEPDRVPVRRGSAQRRPFSGHACGTVLKKGSMDQRATARGHVGVTIARHQTLSGGRVRGAAVMTPPHLRQEETEKRGDNPVQRENQTEEQDTVGAHTCSRADLDSCDTENRAELQSRGTKNKAELHSSDTITTSLVTSQGPCEPCGETKSTQRFDLLRDGSKLVIPIKFRRMFSHNHHLRRKLFTQKLTVRVDTASHRDSFLDKFNQLVEIEEKVQLGEAVNRQLYLHRSLLKQLDQLELNQLSAALSHRDILRKKMVLEMILMTNREAGAEVTLLAQGVANNDPDICEQTVDLPVSLGYRCDALLSLDTGSADESFDYRKERDLLKYIKLQHSIKLLNIQKTVVSQVLEFILPELEQTASETPDSAIPLYRAVYALLNHPAVQLPTVVMESTEES
ncbi:uncharacterized protein LOC135482289 isoform X2 [Liolophura sinensis]|uniref:uncharacterized protein LOC135482289 isoform X2 n=1 Tax=Liolophura sinensis TaxID=3198878 RepID=UPI003158AA21